MTTRVKEHIQKVNSNGVYLVLIPIDRLGSDPKAHNQTIMQKNMY
jgi:hypothetical protein